MKGDEDDVLARSPKLDDIFMDQEHNFQENELGDDLQKYTPKGYIFDQELKKKRGWNNYFWRLTWVGMITRVLEQLFLFGTSLGSRNFGRNEDELGWRFESTFLVLSLGCSAEATHKKQEKKGSQSSSKFFIKFFIFFDFKHRSKQERVF